MDSRFPNGLSAKLAQGVRVNTDRAKGAAALGRGPNKGVQLKSAPWSGTWPAPGATLDLDFANDRGFVRGVGSGRSMDAVTFTRASNGTFVGSDGKLAGSGGNQGALGLNLLTFPQDFDNAAWVKSNASVQANVATAPDETFTADKLVENTANSSHHLLFNSLPTAGTLFTVSVYVKPVERTWFVIQAGGGGFYAYFNLTGSGSLGTVTAGTTANISALANGWYRCSISATAVGLGIYFFIGTANNTITYTGDGTSGIFIWGAQLELGSTATTYYPTNINAPRFDWASTAQVAQVNLLNYSDALDTANWTKSSTSVTANQADPFGGNAAFLITELAATAEHNTARQPNNAAANTAYTFSVYAKANGRQWLMLTGNRDGWQCFFDLVNGVTGNSGAQVQSKSITSVGGGWYRCVISLLPDPFTPTSLLWQIYLSNVNGTNRNPSYAGDGVSGAYLYGPQVQIGSSATAYQAVGQFFPTNTPLLPASTCNGLLIEESRTNRILWCRDGTNNGTAIGTNLLLSSQALNSINWIKFTSTDTLATDGTLAPDSTATAIKYTPSTTSANHFIYQVVSLTGQVNLSLYAKAGGYQRVSIRESGTTGNGACFDLSTGTVVTTVGTGTTASMTAVGNGWYRCNTTVPSWGTTNYNFGIWVNSNTGSMNEVWAANGTNAIYIWGAQMLPGTVLTDYQVTTSAAVYGWGKQNVTIAKNQTGIDGVTNAATSITATAANGTAIQPIVLASGSRTGSVYLKRITGTGNVQVSLDGSTWSTVDLSSTEWRRIVLSGTVTNPVVGIRLATSGDAVAMDYAQVEDGNNVTMPILTTTANATRAVDTATMSGSNFDTWINLQQGTVKCDFIYPMPLGLADQRAVFSIDNNNNGSDFSYIRLFKGSFASAFQAFTNGSSTSSVIPITQNALSSIAISATRTAGFSCPNGGLTYFSGISSGLGTLPFTRLYLGGYAQNIASCVTIKRFVFFPKAMPGSLQTLSTP